MVIHDYVWLCMIKNCSVGLHHGKQRPIFQGHPTGMSMGILTIEKNYGYGWYRVYNICFLLLNLHFFLFRKFLTMCSSPCTGHEALQKKPMGFQASSLEPSDTWQSSRGWQRYARGKTVRIHRPPSFRRKWQQIMPQEHFVH